MQYAVWYLRCSSILHLYISYIITTLKVESNMFLSGEIKFFRMSNLDKIYTRGREGRRER